MSGDNQLNDIIKCRLLGIKKKDWSPIFPTPTFEGNENDIQWVEISGSEYSIDELDLVRWLRTYGELLSSIIQKSEICNIGGIQYVQKISSMDCLKT